MEIERKFRVTQLPDRLAGAPSRPIRQGYLALDGPVEVRVRADGPRHVLTIKGGRGRTRLEEELELDAAGFERLWPLTEGRRVHKRRHRIDLRDGFVLELDVYAGALEGLMTAEIEFVSEAQSEAFIPPAWVGDELTGDARYANQSLAMHGLP
ncbi:MAG: adenylate cyclase [Solirubrobacterales bacterium]|nr:adenylate cyclase [Solirubrobacterales bacterium]